MDKKAHTLTDREKRGMMTERDKGERGERGERRSTIHSISSEGPAQMVGCRGLGGEGMCECVDVDREGKECLCEYGKIFERERMGEEREIGKV